MSTLSSSPPASDVDDVFGLLLGLLTVPSALMRADIALYGEVEGLCDADSSSRGSRWGTNDGLALGLLVALSGLVGVGGVSSADQRAVCTCLRRRHNVCECVLTR